MVQETEYIAPSYDLLHGSEGTDRSHCPLYEHPPTLTNSKTYEGLTNCLKRLQQNNFGALNPTSEI